mgnify:CR=1 FL=1
MFTVEYNSKKGNFSGIINNLMINNGDVSSVLTTKASSTGNVNSSCILKPDICPYSFAMNGPDKQWIQVNFMKGLIHTTSYSLKSSINPVNHSYHLLGWDLMGSLNGRQWNILDSRKNTNEINGYRYECNFTPMKYAIYRYFHLMQTQKRDESVTDIRILEIKRRRRNRILFNAALFAMK